MLESFELGSHHVWSVQTFSLSSPKLAFPVTVAVKALRHFVQMCPTQWGGRLQVLNHGALTSPRATACFMSALHCKSASQMKTASHVNTRCATLHTCECNYAEPMKALCGCFSICFSATTGKVMHLCFGAGREKQARTGNLFSSFPARRTQYSNCTLESDGVYFIFSAFWHSAVARFSSFFSLSLFFLCHANVISPIITPPFSPCCIILYNSYSNKYSP